MSKDKKTQTYRLYIDDSGQYRSLIKHDGTVNSEANLTLPYGLTGAILISDSIENDLREEWLSLKNEIASELGLSIENVPIHQRIMYGKTVNQFHRDEGKKPNPYYPVDSKRRLEWIYAARKILFKYSFLGKRGGLIGHYHLSDNMQVALHQSAFFSHPISVHERAWIRTKDKDLYDKLHKIITNPTVDSYARAVFGAGEILRTISGSAKFNTYFDQNPDATGFETLEAFETIRNYGHLANLSNLYPTNWKKDCLLEVADLYAYWTHRNHHIQRVDSIDPILTELEKKYPLPHRGFPQLQTLRQTQIARLCILVHFELGRRRVAAENPILATEFATVEEFLERLNHVEGDVLGYPLLRSSPARCYREKMAGAGIRPGPSESSMSKIGLLMQPLFPQK